uniref:uncharacterized protein isoform X2 n=1 Tax=Semicossyphus pulcher TaxID=241346 RepID=UPI0037E735CE
MKLLLSSLLLASFCALSSWSVSSGTVVVTQSPDVSVMEGETLNISCCWTGEFERGRVTWLKNGTSINTEILILKNHSQKPLEKETSNCLNLTFPNITRKDSGRYICRFSVEIPDYTKVEGDGTVITVTDRETTENNTGEYKHEDSASSLLPIPVIVSLAVLAPLLLISLLCFCALRRTHAARVIYEVPHTDSEEAEMDKHSTSSSRGSSQWCQVPVYESFDYFERVQDKESG